MRPWKIRKATGKGETKSMREENVAKALGEVNYHIVHPFSNSASAEVSLPKDQSCKVMLQQKCCRLKGQPTWYLGSLISH